MPTCPHCHTYQDPRRVICLGWSQSCIRCWVGASKESWVAEDGAAVRRRWKELYGDVTADSILHPCIYIHAMARSGLVEDFRRALFTAFYELGYTQLHITGPFSPSYQGLADQARELADCTLILGDTVETASQELLLHGGRNESLDFLPRVLLVLVGAHPDEVQENFLSNVSVVSVTNTTPDNIQTVLARIQELIDQN